MTTLSDALHHDRGERGTTLILAMVFIFVMAIALVALGGLAANSLLNTSNARVQRTSVEDSEAAVTVAMQYLRYDAAPASYPSCLPPSGVIPSSDPGIATQDPVQVNCTWTVNPTSPQTRRVEFYACPSGAPAANCVSGNSSVLLHAEVIYDDFNPNDHLDDCSGAVTTSCGIGMDIDLWDVTSADN
jgi:Tfp pilus assembly protein PilV